jgi:hypothetical protein
VRTAGLVPSARTLHRALSGTPIGVEYIRPVARGLRVKPSAISDWTGDDDIWDDPEMKIPALDAKQGPAAPTTGPGKRVTAHHSTKRQ